MKRTRLFLNIGSIFLSLFVTVGAARATDLVVVEARGVGLKSGDIVDSTKALDLDEGQRVTLVTPDGKTVKLRGPFHQSPIGGDATGNSVTVALSGLLVQKDVRTADVGVVRAGTVVHLPEPWVVDVSHAGNRCFREGEPVVFWRDTQTATRELSVTPLDRAWRETAAWTKGSDRLPAPKDLPLPGRVTYLVDIGDGPVAVTLIKIPASMNNDRMRAAWMFEKACNLQAETLAQTIK
jgi:hypothetical protein